MAKALTIIVTKASDFKSITLTDDTDWGSLGDTIDDLTSIVLNFYTTSTDTVYDTYTLSAAELLSYVSNGYVTLTFLTMFGTDYISDNWYDIQMVANDGDYESNLDGFATYAYIEPVVYINNLNNLHTPDEYRGSIENVALQVMWLKGLDYLDTSTVNDRRIKSIKRLKGIIKLNR